MRYAPLIACQECDLLQQETSLQAGAAAHCNRCGTEVYRQRAGSLDLSLACAPAAGVFFFVADTFPIVRLQIQTEPTQSTLFGAVHALAAQGMWVDHGVAAASVGLWVCNLCKLVSKSPLQGSIGHCPRCGARIHARKPHAIARTWALLITAAMLYIPANVLPVMETSSLFGFQKDTILSGVVYLWISGSQPLSLLVFIASI